MGLFGISKKDILKWENDGNLIELIGVLKNGNPSIVELAVIALAHLNDMQAVKPLIEIRKHKSAKVRLSVIVALHALGDKRAVNVLIKMTGDQNTDVRLAAAMALGSFGSDLQEIMPKLKTMAIKGNVIAMIAFPTNFGLSDYDPEISNIMDIFIKYGDEKDI
jgi:HEAT repeat protein